MWDHAKHIPEYFRRKRLNAPKLKLVVWRASPGHDGGCLTWLASALYDKEAALKQTHSEARLFLCISPGRGTRWGGVQTVLRTPSQFGSASPPFLPSERQRDRALPEASSPGGELRSPPSASAPGMAPAPGAGQGRAGLGGGSAPRWGRR